MSTWLFYCFIITATYSSQLKDFLILPRYYPAIKNLHDMTKTDLSILINPYNVAQAKQVYQITGDPDLLLMLNKASSIEIKMLRGSVEGVSLNKYQDSMWVYGRGMLT